MTWLTPILAGAAAAVAIPALLILYFLKLRRREVEISTTLLWKKAIEDLRANAPFQRLRRNILLVLQMLALIAALLAVAQPELRANLGAGERTVILIDRSASMSARDGAQPGETRLDQAKREAKAFVESMREPGLIRSLGALGGPSASDEAMVVAFDTGAQVVHPFSGNKRALLAAIDAIAPTDAPARLEEALRLAGAYAAPSGAAVDEDSARVGASAALRLWSDGRIADAGAARVGPEVPVTYLAVGREDASNVGIVSLGAERQFDDPSRVSVFVGLQSSSSREVTADIELSVDGVVSSVRSVTLPARDGSGPSDSGVVFGMTQPGGALVRVRVVVPEALRGEDLLDSDNTAHLWLAPARRASVLLVTGGSLYLQLALEGLNLARLDTMTPAEFARESERAGGAASAPYDVVVLDGESSTAGLRALAPGRYLSLGAPLPLEGVAFSSEAGPTIVLDYQRDHPALRHAGLDRVTIARAHGIDLPPSARALARGERGALIAELTDATGDTLVLGFDPAQSDWPFDVGFVVFLGEAVKRLSQGGEDSQGMVRPGSVARAALPSDARGVTLVAPGASGATGAPGAPVVVNDAGVALFGPLPRAGLYALRWDGSPGATDMTVGGRAQRPIAANLLDAFESEARAIATLDLGVRRIESSDADRSGAGRRALWPWLILACLAALMVEWWVYNRKVMV